jgi:hypothetical protein
LSTHHVFQIPAKARNRETKKKEGREEKGRKESSKHCYGFPWFMQTAMMMVVMVKGPSDREAMELFSLPPFLYPFIFLRFFLKFPPSSKH